MRALIYCRISNDPSGSRVGVTRQERECRELLARRGFDVVEVLVDNDISAYSGVKRPAYSRLLDIIRSGSANAVAAWHPDRLHRSIRELEEFISLLDAYSIDVFTVTAGDVDLATPIGRMIARQLGTFARYESEHRSERSVAGKRDAARAGRWSGAAPYGYELVRDAAGNPTRDGRLLVVPEAARVIREAARRVLAGDSVYRVCHDLNQRGLPAPRGGPWRTPALRSILVSPTAAGLRDYKGTVVADGLWDGILSIEQHKALRERLSDNRRSKGVRLRSKYLLTGGIIVCGRCSTRLYNQWKPGRQTRVYACIPGVDKGGCGGISIVADPLEALVTNAVFERFGRRSMARMVANPLAFTRELRRRVALESRMLELAEIYAEGQVTRAEWLCARDRLAKSMGDIPAEPGHLGALSLGNPTALHSEWERLPVDRRRSLLHLTVDRVIVAPAASRGGRFNPDRVTVLWR